MAGLSLRQLFYLLQRSALKPCGIGAAAGEYAVYYAVFAEQRVQYVHGHYLGVAVFFRQLFAVVYGLYAVLCKAVAVHVMPPCGGIAAPCAARTSGIAP